MTTYTSDYGGMKSEPQFTLDELQIIYKSVLERKKSYRTKSIINKYYDYSNVNNLCDNILQKVAPLVGEQL